MVWQGGERERERGRGRGNKVRVFVRVEICSRSVGYAGECTFFGVVTNPVSLLFPSLHLHLLLTTLMTFSSLSPTATAASCEEDGITRCGPPAASSTSTACSRCANNASSTLPTSSPTPGTCGQGLTSPSCWTCVWMSVTGHRRGGESVRINTTRPLLKKSGDIYLTPSQTSTLPKSYLSRHATPQQGRTRGLQKIVAIKTGGKGSEEVAVREGLGMLVQRR